MTEKCPNFDKSVKYILETAMEIHDKAYGKGSDSKRLWMICVEKFFKVYTKVNKPEKFYDIFVNFFRQHMDGFVLPILQSSQESNSVNDTWLKDETFKDEVKQVKEKSNDWEPRVKRCRGWVIYASEVKEQNLISIPISEIYLTAIKLCREEKSKDPVCATYPAKILFSLFSIVYHVLPDAIYSEQRIKIKDNIDLLSEHIVTILPDDAEMGDEIGSGFKAISNMVNQVAKSSGLTENKVDTSIIEKSMGEVIKKDNLAKIGGLLQSAYDVFKSAESTSDGIPGIMEKIGKTLQSDEVKSKISEVKMPNFPIKNNDLLSTISSSSSSSTSSEGNSNTNSTFDPSEQD
jgi:hypothetical protein